MCGRVGLFRWRPKPAADLLVIPFLSLCKSLRLTLRAGSRLCMALPLPVRILETPLGMVLTVPVPSSKDVCHQETSSECRFTMSSPPLLFQHPRPLRFFNLRTHEANHAVPSFAEAKPSKPCPRYYSIYSRPGAPPSCGQFFRREIWRRRLVVQFGYHLYNPAE